MHHGRAGKGRTKPGVFIRGKKCTKSHSETLSLRRECAGKHHQYTDVNLDNLGNFKLVSQTLWLRVPPISRNCAQGRRSFSASNLSFGVIETAFSFSVRRAYKNKKRPFKRSSRYPFWQRYSLTRETGRQEI